MVNQHPIGIMELHDDLTRGGINYKINVKYHLDNHSLANFIQIIIITIVITIPSCVYLCNHGWCVREFVHVLYVSLYSFNFKD